MRINFCRRLETYLLFPLLLVTCCTSDASQEYGLSVPGKSTRPVLYFADKALELGDPQAIYAVVIVHGLNGGTSDSTTSIRNSLRKRYPDTVNKILFIAPCFLSSSLQGSSLIDKYAYWSGSTWSRGDDSPIVNALSSYDVMDALLGVLGDASKFPRLKHVFVGGFSAGGQYVIRYVCVGNFVKREDVQYDFAAGAPSSWLYLDNARIKDNGELSPYGDQYPGYDDWRYGLQNRNRYAGRVQFETIAYNVVSRRTLCFCGTADDDPTGADLDVSVGAMAQGATRYERYLNYREYALRHPEWYANTHFIEVLGVGHSSSSCYADSRILDFAMGHAIGWNCDNEGNRRSVRYVNGFALRDGDGLTEESPVRSLSNAIAQAEDGDRIVLQGGIYPPIDTSGKRIIVEGAASGDRPVIDGGNTSRCITVGSGASWTNSIFRNLTLRNGWSGYGGGARGGIFENCIIENNVATNTGGGAYGCVLVNCMVQSNSSIYAAGVTRSFVYQSRLINNVSTGAGGGAHRSNLFNSLIVWNRAEGTDSYGGGCYECTNMNCTVYGNYAGARGGGVYGGISTNCIVWANSSGNGYPNFRNSGPCGYCLSGTSQTGVGNITGDPKMNVPEKGDFRLRSDSPCLNAGWNGAVTGLTDVLGHSRIQNGTVDIGACEGVAQSTLRTEVEVPYWWLDQYPALLKTYGGDYELAANAKTGKRSAGAKEMCVWEDYVAGTDPTKSNDVLKAYIHVDAKGKISISYSPVFTDEESRAMRKYTTMGKRCLSNGNWSEVPEGKESEYNFFKVKVEMR